MRPVGGPRTLQRGETTATMLGRKPQAMAGAPERSRWATVRVETDGGAYVGRLYVPDARRVSDVLADDHRFLSLTEVKLDDGNQVEAFMAVNKSFIRALRVLDEGTPEEAARGAASSARPAEAGRSDLGSDLDRARQVAHGAAGDGDAIAPVLAEELAPARGHLQRVQPLPAQALRPERHQRAVR